MPAGERTTLKPPRPRASRPQLGENAIRPTFARDEPHVGEVQPYPGLDRVLVELPEGGDYQPGVSWMGNRLWVQSRGSVYGEEPEAQGRRYSGERGRERRVARGGERGARQERLDVEVRRALAGAGHAGHVDVMLGCGGVRGDPDEPGLAFLRERQPFPAGGRLYAPRPPIPPCSRQERRWPCCQCGLRSRARCGRP